MSLTLHVERCTRYSDWLMGPAEIATFGGPPVRGSLQWHFSNQAAGMENHERLASSTSFAVRCTRDIVTLPSNRISVTMVFVNS